MWNAAFSERDQERATRWSLLLRPFHSEVATQTLIEMMMAKEKWGVMYSEQQEAVLARTYGLLRRQQHQAEHGHEKEARVKEHTVDRGRT